MTTTSHRVKEDGLPLSIAVLALAAVLFCKYLYLAFFVTPLWDIPDETGHLAYVMEIAEGRGVPILGSAQIPSEIMAHMRNTHSAAPSGNWIAQHPPFYYLVAALPYWFAEFFTSNIEILYRIPRIVAAACGALLVLVLYRMARLLGHGDRAALCFSGCAVSIPMVSHLSSGTSHDVPIFFVAALSLFFLVRFILRHELRDAYFAAIVLGLAGSMKMTAWLLLPPFLVIMAWELRGPGRSWALQFLCVGAAATALPAAWMLRNLYQYGDPTYTALVTSKWQLAEPLRSSFLTFLSTTPVIDQYLLHYYGLIGWAGTGAGKLNWFQVAGFPRLVFTVALLTTSILLLWQFCVSVLRPMFSPSLRYADEIVGLRLRRRQLWPYAQLVTAITVATVFVFFICVPLKSSADMTLRLTAIALIIALGAGACIALLFGGRSDRRLFLYGLACFMFFCVVLSIQIYGIYLLDGRLRATHGRYLYPVMPWLLMSLCIALAARPWGERLLLIAFPLLVLAETDAYINQVLPFIGGGVP